jgi:hypothetical protein
MKTIGKVFWSMFGRVSTSVPTLSQVANATRTAHCAIAQLIMLLVLALPSGRGPCVELVVSNDHVDIRCLRPTRVGG